MPPAFAQAFSHIEPTLRQWIAGDPITDAALQDVAAQLSVQQDAVPSSNAVGLDLLRQRALLLQANHGALETCCRDELGWAQTPLELVWTLWLPLALQLHTRQRSLGRPLVQGFLGGQGTGKTTLTQVLAVLLQSLGHRVCRLSIDDLYKTYEERQEMQQRDPRLRWRGPPGTHDLALGLAVLQALRAGSSDEVEIPRFDKSAHGGAGDRTQPEHVHDIDLVLFEGWFTGMRPIDPACFDQAPPPIKTEGDRTFARDCNQRLREYLPLWDYLDGLVVLHPEDYRLSKAWRTEAEHAMKRSGRAGMSDAELSQFVDYFWKALHPELFLPPLLRDPQRVDLVIELGGDRHPSRLWSPAP